MSVNSKMRVPLLALVLLGMSAIADPLEAATVTRSISVTGQGEASGKPDQAEVSAGVQTTAKTVIEASRENQAVLSKILEALDEQGIPETDIQTADYSIWAEQNYDGPEKERITGYRVSNIVHVKIKDIDKTGDVLAAVTNAGANSINGIQFSVADTAALELQAREAAMADARARAESLARLAGVKLGEVLTLTTSAAPEYPRPFMSGRAFETADASAPAPGIVAGQQSVNVQIHVTFAIQ
ncbi:MAG: SIMPL domain-containing protein [Woeseiaceae bacterium]